MRFIATRMQMPDVDDETNKSKECQELKRQLKAWRNEELEMLDGPGKNMKGKDGQMRHLSERDMSRLQSAERTHVREKYLKWWQNALEQPVDEALWSVQVLDQIDKIYVEKIQKTGAMEHYGHKDGKWRTAMVEYNAAVKALLLEAWVKVSDLAKEQRKEEEAARKEEAAAKGEGEGESSSSGAATEDQEMETESVVFEAENKIKWMERVYECGQGFDIPWPTITFQRDFIKQLERYSLGIQWVSGMCYVCRTDEGMHRSRACYPRGRGYASFTGLLPTRTRVCVAFQT